MNIQQIIYVVEVYKLHSFSLAAHSLFVSQPRLSQAIRDLERELGFDTERASLEPPCADMNLSYRPAMC